MLFFQQHQRRTTNDRSMSDQSRNMQFLEENVMLYLLFCLHICVISFKKPFQVPDVPFHEETGKNECELHPSPLFP